MAENKHINRKTAVIMMVALTVCLVIIGFSDSIVENSGGTDVEFTYESSLFDTSAIISVDIIMDGNDWNDMLENAITEEYYECDVVINGEKFKNVGIRPKGNMSLSAIVSDPNCDRFSFKLEFGHFVKGQTCFGLDKLILNNNYGDATNMKEAVIYDMFNYLGADASLYNYAEVSLNGEYRGVYLALEGVEKSFMFRNYGTRDGELYKPESMEMGGGKLSSSSSGAPLAPGGGGFGGEQASGGSTGGENFGEASQRRSSGNRPGGFSMDGNVGRAPGGFSMGGNGANLNYTDDELDSYSTIWEGEITSTGKKDHRRVVEALKNISEGNDLEKYLDVENVLKYMAVHTFAVNQDSLSGSMAHNYYLYEYDGQLNIIPWDYNLSLGGMSMGSTGNATDIVNDAINTPFDATNFFDALLENEEYLTIYHEYLRVLAEEYVDGGRFDEVYNRITLQIDELVKADPTAFYNYDEYTAAKEMLNEVIKLRARSIEGQLSGTIASTDEGQKSDKSGMIDASHIDVKVMGQFSMGGFGGGIKERWKGG